MSQLSKIRIGREPFNGYSHLLASLLALVGSVLLLGKVMPLNSDSWVLLFYASTLFAAMFSSAAYHLVIGSPRVIEVLRNIDHWCIRGLIVGTFAPLAFEMLSMTWAVAWVVALVLMVLFDAVRCVIQKTRNKRGRAAWSYIIIASSTLIAVPFLWADHSGLILWVCSGSLFYIIGAYCYIQKVPRGSKVLNFHEVWHLCVMVGAFVHYTAIYHIS